MSLEHMVLAKRHKFKFDSITDCEPVLELYKRGELESIFMGSNLLLRRKDENTVYKTNVDKFIVNLSRLLEGSWKDIDN
jgi:hypothetical protein